MRVDQLLASASVSVLRVLLLVPTEQTQALGSDLATDVATRGAVVGDPLIGGGRRGPEQIRRQQHLLSRWLEPLRPERACGGCSPSSTCCDRAARPPEFVTTAVDVNRLAHVLIRVTDGRRLRAERTAAHCSMVAALSQRVVPAVREGVASLRGVAELLAETAMDCTADVAGLGVALAATPDEFLGDPEFSILLNGQLTREPRVAPERRLAVVATLGRSRGEQPDAAGGTQPSAAAVEPLGEPGVRRQARVQ